MHTLPSIAARPIRTRFIGAREAIALVQTLGISHALRGIGQAIEADFLRWHEFDKTPRVAAHSAQGVIELMPIADAQLHAFKWVNGHPGNTRHGLPTVMAYGGLGDVATGQPLLISEMTLLTALRTAAMSALAAQALARPNSRVMALIGNGAQAEFQALAMRDRLGIDTLRLFDTDPAATAKLMRNLQDTGLRLIPCNGTAEAVHGSDIVTTITADKTRATIITPDMLEPGMHFNAVGGDCPGKTELHPEVLARSAVFVEYERQTRVEGDLQQMPADFAVTELWRVLSAQARGRSNSQQTTVFDSVGFAIEDFSTLHWLHRQAQALGLGEWLELVPAQSDVKDLFGVLGASQAAPTGVAMAATTATA